MDNGGIDMNIARLQLLGGSVALIIPRRVCREMGWTKGLYVTIETVEPRTMLVQTAEGQRDDTLPRGGYSVRKNRGAPSYAARLDRPSKARGTGG